MKRRKKEDTIFYLFSAVMIVLFILSACGVEYTEPVTAERSEIQVAVSPAVEIADSTVQERTTAVQTDYFREYAESIELQTKTEGETSNDERTGNGTDILESTTAEDSGRDVIELSDSGRDISDSGELQEYTDEAGADDIGESGTDAEHLSEPDGAEQDYAGAEYDTDLTGEGNADDGAVVAEDYVDGSSVYAAEETTAYEENITYVGDWTVTFYCDCSECVGQYAGMNMTASGRAPIPWYTVATGSSYPFGTQLYIEGFGYFEVMDRGVSDGWADIFVSSHSEIPSYGMTTASVYIVG